MKAKDILFLLTLEPLVSSGRIGRLKYLLLSALLYAPGAILFAKAKRELGQAVFTNIEKVIFAAVVIGALVAAYGLYDGFLTL